MVLTLLLQEHERFSHSYLRNWLVEGNNDKLILRTGKGMRFFFFFLVKIYVMISSDRCWESFSVLGLHIGLRSFCLRYSLVVNTKVLLSRGVDGAPVTDIPFSV